MDRVVAFSLGPLEIRIREELEEFDNRVSVDLPHLHVQLSDLSWAIKSVERFSEDVSHVLGGTKPCAVLDLAYFDAGTLPGYERPQGPTAHESVGYGFVMTVEHGQADSFPVHITVTPALDELRYSADFTVSRQQLQMLQGSLASRWEG